MAAELAKLMSDLEEINMKAVGAEVAHQESVQSVAAPIHAIIKI